VAVEKFLDCSADATGPLIQYIFFKGWQRGCAPKRGSVRAPIPESTADRLTQTKPGDRLVCRLIGHVEPI
jgi:hypothetical protein